MNPSQTHHADLVDKIRHSTSILVVVGAGLSRPSGLPTFREDPGFWAKPVEEIATPEAFNNDPKRVWDVYERLRKLCRNAAPNDGHIALARLARAKPGLLTVSQNIDGLLQKARYPEEQMVMLHGSLTEFKCSNERCDYAYETPNSPETNNVTSTMPGSSAETQTLCNEDTQVPTCPSCTTALIRPGITWFGEQLPREAMDHIDAWFGSLRSVDLVLVIGTTRHPFVREAQVMGAEAAYFNFFEEDLEDVDDGWYVNGDASKTLPMIVEAGLSYVH